MMPFYTKAGCDSIKGSKFADGSKGDSNQYGECLVATGGSFTYNNRAALCPASSSVCEKKGDVGEWQCPGEDKKINCEYVCDDYEPADCDGGGDEDFDFCKVWKGDGANDDSSVTTVTTITTATTVTTGTTAADTTTSTTTTTSVALGDDDDVWRTNNVYCRKESLGLASIASLSSATCKHVLKDLQATSGGALLTYCGQTCGYPCYYSFRIKSPPQTETINFLGVRIPAGSLQRDKYGAAYVPMEACIAMLDTANALSTAADYTTTATTTTATSSTTTTTTATATVTTSTTTTTSTSATSSTTTTTNTSTTTSTTKSTTTGTTTSTTSTTGTRLTPEVAAPLGTTPSTTLELVAELWPNGKQNTYDDAGNLAVSTGLKRGDEAVVADAATSFTSSRVGTAAASAGGLVVLLCIVVGALVMKRRGGVSAASAKSQAAQFGHDNDDIFAAGAAGRKGKSKGHGGGSSSSNNNVSQTAGDENAASPNGQSRVVANDTYATGDGDNAEDVYAEVLAVANDTYDSTDNSRNGATYC